MEAPMKRTNRRMAAMVGIVVAIIALASGTKALAASGPLFATASQPAVPAGGAVGSAESATLSTISCTAPGDCVAGGSYRTTGGGEQAMVETQTGGVWGAPQRIVPPPGAATGPKSQNATIESVSCPAQGFCVAVGSYRGGTG